MTEIFMAATQQKKIEGHEFGSPGVHPFGIKGPGLSCAEENKEDGVQVFSEIDCSHGTHVSGLIVGGESEEFGTIGLCPMCQLMVLKLMESGQSGGVISDLSIFRALKYIKRYNEKAKEPVRLVNASFGKFQRSRAIALLVHYLRETYGTLVISAAGNEDSLKGIYPGESH